MLNNSISNVKGIIEGCILGIISCRETFGYEASEELKKQSFSKIYEGTIYPLLSRLEKNNFIVVEYRGFSIGPKHKYFSIKSEGSKELNDFFLNRLEMCCAIN